MAKELNLYRLLRKYAWNELKSYVLLMMKERRSKKDITFYEMGYESLRTSLPRTSAMDVFYNLYPINKVPTFDERYIRRYKGAPCHHKMISISVSSELSDMSQGEILARWIIYLCDRTDSCQWKVMRRQIYRNVVERARTPITVISYSNAIYHNGGNEADFVRDWKYWIKGKGSMTLSDNDKTYIQNRPDYKIFILESTLSELTNRSKSICNTIMHKLRGRNSIQGYDRFFLRFVNSTEYPITNQEIDDIIFCLKTKTKISDSVPFTIEPADGLGVVIQLQIWAASTKGVIE